MIDRRLAQDPIALPHVHGPQHDRLTVAYKDFQRVIARGHIKRHTQAIAIGDDLAGLPQIEGIRALHGNVVVSTVFVTG